MIISIFRHTHKSIVSGYDMGTCSAATFHVRHTRTKLGLIANIDHLVPILLFQNSLTRFRGNPRELQNKKKKLD